MRTGAAFLSLMASSRATLSVGQQPRPSHLDIFVVGDTAAVTDQPGIPGTAALAKLCRLAHRRGAANGSWRA